MHVSLNVPMWLYLLPETCNSFFSYWFPAYLFLFVVFTTLLPIPSHNDCRNVSDIWDTRTKLNHISSKGLTKKEEEGKANKQKRWQNVAAFWAKNRNLKAESPIRRGVFWEYWGITYSLAEATDVQLTQGAGVWVCVCLGVCAASAMQGNKPKIRQQQNHKTKATHTQTQTHKHTHTQLWQVNEVILIMATMVDHLVHQHAAGICHGPETRI